MASQDVSQAPALSRLRAGDPVFGVLQTVPATPFTELALWSGYDFVILDCEHGLVDEVLHMAMLQIIGASAGFSAVRVRPEDYQAVGRYLDMGVDCVLMPDLQSAEAARRFVAAATPGPHGTRSSTGAGARCGRYGLGRAPDRTPLLLAMIESGTAVEEIEAIAGVPGLSGFVVGPHDLSADLGCPGAFDDPGFDAAMAAVEAAARRHGLILGSGATAIYPVDRLLAAGHRFLLASTDIRAMRDGLAAHLSAAHGAAKAGPAGKTA
ncbi:MAG: 4-hydroxy-2-oxo-heptane,7-dioate aldolase [Bradyrhizobium sp.]|nr:4-hydroxy-2-oxo-heptane,7-dioate aldolase [Bradyrhizobium sp.]